MMELKQYDIELYNRIMDKINVPLIISSGIGSYKHIVDAVKLCNATKL